MLRAISTQFLISAFVLAVSVLGIGCSGTAPSRPSHVELRTVSSAGSPTRDDLIRAVARGRTQLETREAGFHWIGKYAGTSSRGCERVTLTLANDGHERHYEVCGGQILEIAEVAPAPPRDRQLKQVMESLSQAAWRTGRLQTMSYQGYELEAEPVGPELGRGCVQIERRILWGNMLVASDSHRVCGR